VHTPWSSLPIGHSVVQLVQLLLSAKSIPSVHSMQALDPVSDAYEPGEHWSHVDDADTGANSPRAHSRQFVLPGSGLWKPGVHAEQLSLEEP
jgi:hypothetical protein